MRYFFRVGPRGVDFFGGRIDTTLEGEARPARRARRCRQRAMGWPCVFLHECGKRSRFARREALVAIEPRHRLLHRDRRSAGTRRCARVFSRATRPASVSTSMRFMTAGSDIATAAPVRSRRSCRCCRAAPAARAASDPPARRRCGPGPDRLLNHLVLCRP